VAWHQRLGGILLGILLYINFLEGRVWLDEESAAGPGGAMASFYNVSPDRKFTRDSFNKYVFLIYTYLNKLLLQLPIRKPFIGVDHCYVPKVR